MYIPEANGVQDFGVNYFYKSYKFLNLEFKFKFLVR